ncbi:MAG: ABC transporter ATP-binding protein [Candidatus Omnitrophica bacterium CG11_big_fil_rev_8_21_14_0_20_42_13]|uniref:ABC transporter ATP-binding protein n=1 Tax=Candidatus Ghiorseimicrobium undicola TaxID=1974746 RepID=A0A2H0LVY6_9BACT|nr:MAG: ABC transporter ATP-binding protein [Candidatus Omnitrophica bacterium CG11_big_fil_rev_8_21_14_0_20_42_13]
MIEIIGVHKSFNDHKVLDSIDLKIEKGKTKVIIGRSGCGKSVLLKHMVGILEPDEGTVKIEGVVINKLKEKELNKMRMKIGMLFQGGALFDSLTVAQNVGFVLEEHTDTDKDAVRERVKEALSLVGLQAIEDLMPSELSGGMKKRVALARAICMRPEIILYDEPTTGVDPITADAINDLIREMQNKLRITSVVVTHDMTSAYKVADQIAMLYQGKIIAEGTPEEIKNSNNQIVKQFVTGAAYGPITETEHLVFGHLK